MADLQQRPSGMRNCTSTSPDTIRIFWQKKLTCLHENLVFMNPLLLNFSFALAHLSHWPGGYLTPIISIMLSYLYFSPAFHQCQIFLAVVRITHRILFERFRQLKNCIFIYVIEQLFILLVFFRLKVQYSRVLSCVIWQFLSKHFPNDT